MSIGLKIKELRESKGFSQTDLADKLNTTKQTIYKYETGIVTNIPSDKIEALAKVFNVSPSYLMGWDEDVSAQNEAIYESFQKNAVAFGVISKEESELLDLFRSASEDKKVSILNVVRALVE